MPEQIVSEYGLLRRVYESARKLLRSTEPTARNAAFDTLDGDIEAVKEFDGGTMDDTGILGDIVYRLRAPPEWGYRDKIVDGFVEDRLPFAAADEIDKLRAPPVGSMEVVERTNAIIAKVRFDMGEPYYFEAKVSARGEAYVQAHYEEDDVYTRQPAMQYTRRWILSPAMTDSEIVFTLFKLCLTSAEHRTREAFLYKGARIASPHFDVEDLVVLCKTREAAGGRQ